MAAMSNDFSALPVPTYFIYRDVPEGQLYDPTAALAFCPPKDSDELFDALRAKYPHLKSHSERMRDATIEFLLEEREAEALSANVSPAMPSLYDSMTDSMTDTSPWQQSWPSASMTTLSSPEMTNFATPAFSNSPKPQIPQMMRSQSSAATPSETQTPALESMTGVFSLSTTEQPKQRVRRKMTDLEKADYRKRRIVKACDSCSKRKRKCVHNESKMEDLKKSSNDKTTHKVTKPRHNTAKQPQAAEVSFSFDHHATNPGNAFAADGFAGGYEDFTLMFDDPTLDFSLDEFMPFDPLNSNTKPDNFSQCVQNFSASPGRSHSTLDAPHNWNVFDTNTTGSFEIHPQSFEQANNVTDLLIPHSSQIVNDHESRRRCDLTHSQTESSLTSGAHMASAGQLDAHGNQLAANASSSNAKSVNATSVNATSINANSVNATSTTATSKSGDSGVFTQSTRTWHVHEPKNSLQVDSDRGGSPGEGDPGMMSGGQAELPPLIGGGIALADTALRRSRRPAMSAFRSAAGTSPQSNLRRHRTRSDGVYDPALQSELSLTSATNSSTGSNMEHTATLEGRPGDLGGTPVSPHLSPSGGRVNRRPIDGDSTHLSSTLTPRSSPSQGANAPLSSPLLSRSSPTVPNPTRVSIPAPSQQTRSQSALFARPSPFDRVGGTHARSTELFRLKHRIPASLDTSAPATGSVPSATNLSAQANGGAYPRLRSVAAANSSSTATTATQQQTTRSSQSTPRTTDTSKATEASGARMLFTESDTKRYRDHHGRAASQEGAATATIADVASVAYAFARNAMAILVLGVMLMSTSIVAHPSSLLLATLAPVLVAHNNWSAGSRSLLSRAHRALTSTREKHQASLERFSLHRPLGCV